MTFFLWLFVLVHQLSLVYFMCFPRQFFFCGGPEKPKHWPRLFYTHLIASTLPQLWSSFCRSQNSSLLCTAGQKLANYCSPTIFVNKASLEHVYIHLFTLATFTLQWQSWIVARETIWSESLKHLLSIPLQETYLTYDLHPWCLSQSFKSQQPSPSTQLF